MNLKKLHWYIDQYKKDFDRISKKEIYKWKAIKTFQESFNIESKDIHANLELALSNTGNLLDSFNYFPKRMLLENSEKSPKEVRSSLLGLFDEEYDYAERIDFFKDSMKTLNAKNFREKSGYQDHHAISTYLSLKYPDEHYIYKFGILKKVSALLEHSYIPVKGQVENLRAWQHLCDEVREVIEQDQELLHLHSSRLDTSCYRDRAHHLLTQDFMYAVAIHLSMPKMDFKSSIGINSIESSSAKDWKNDDRKQKRKFTARKVDFDVQYKKNQKIGLKGELWALHYEKESLKQDGRHDLAEQVEHVSVKYGDGAGYDIKSFDKKGNKKYIEVKTTKGKCSNTFYISANELDFSTKQKSRYFLYRVFDFDINAHTASLSVINGSLKGLCIRPEVFSVNLTKI